MTTSTKTRKSIAPVVEGTVVSSDAVVFVAPKTAKERQAASAANVSRIRESVTALNRETGRLLSFLVLALVLNPSKSDDTDALTALTTGDGKVDGLTPKMLSYARAAHVLVTEAHVTSTEDPRWTVALHTAHKMGVGRERITTALGKRRAGNSRRALAESILSAAAEKKGKERDEVIRQAFPSTRNSDGNSGTGSKAFRTISDALTKVNEALTVKVADGGMTDEERATVAALLARAAERAGDPA